MSGRVAFRALSIDASPPALAGALGGRDRLAFLDSSQVSAQLGRYSFLLWEPRAIFEATREGARLREGGTWRAIGPDVFAALREVLRERAVEVPAGAPAPFLAGAVGYFSYDLGGLIERLPHRANGEPELPLVSLGLYDRAIVYDNLSRSWYASACAFGDASPEPLLDAVEADVAVAAQSAVDDDPPPAAPITLSCSFTREEYLDRVRRALAYIRDGDIYQVNLARRFTGSLVGEPFDVYRRLRAATPSRYGAYLDCGDFQIASASPELFLRRTGRRVESRPIKGTRPRRADDADFNAHAVADLISSTKDRAELSMIVDLVRNDLGRVCDYGTVRVDDHAWVDELPTVFHTVSTVQGMLYEGMDAIHLLRAAFPGGSVTGAPKIRAMEIIDELESVRRGPYTGALGYIGYNGDLSLNMVIRTIVMTRGQVMFHAGGGIVADSDPEAELDETADKARAMIAAVGGR
ncbi:aminodeoxychorismate synthase component I [bacterium]|nr:aminodeoxychorismate synthase component I [bacterium]